MPRKPSSWLKSRRQICASNSEAECHSYKVEVGISKFPSRTKIRPHSSMAEHRHDMAATKARFLLGAPNKECHSSEVINSISQSTKMRGAEWPRGLISLRFQEHALTPHLCTLYSRRQYDRVTRQLLLMNDVAFSCFRSVSSVDN